MDDEQEELAAEEDDMAQPSGGPRARLDVSSRRRGTRLDTEAMPRGERAGMSTWTAPSPRQSARAASGLLGPSSTVAFGAAVGDDRTEDDEVVIDGPAYRSDEELSLLATHDKLVPVDKGWHWSMAAGGGRDFLDRVFPTGSRVMGLLDEPQLPPDFPVSRISFKVALVGGSGVGKSALMANLCGLPVPVQHVETGGCDVCHAYWPVRLARGQILLVRFQFWDVGSVAARKFSYLRDASLAGAQAILYCFSTTDRTTFEELPALMDAVAAAGGRGRTGVIVGTKHDKGTQQQVTEAELASLSAERGMAAYRVSAFERGFLPGADDPDGATDAKNLFAATTSDAVVLLSDLVELLFNLEDDEDEDEV